MTRFLTLWLEKRRLKYAYAEKLKELLVMNFFGDTDIEKRLPELEASYIKLGLTKQELEKVRNNLGPIHISG